jgi:chromosome segregation ATPase
MSVETTYKGKIEDWNHLQERLTANAADLAHLEVLRAQLGTVMEQARQMVASQAAQRAAKQQASKSLKAAIIEGDRLTSLLRAAVKQHYGPASEKVAEFGVQPFRGRKRTSKEKPAPTPAPAPGPAPAPTPHAAAAPAAEPK